MEFLRFLRRTASRLYPGPEKAAFALVSMLMIFKAIDPAHAQAGIQAQEYALKAALLAKFGLYVEWPKSAFSSPTSPINLCVAGEDPFGDSLDELLVDERINNRKVISRRLETVEQNSGCHILFIGEAGRQTVAQIIEALRGGNVLTVSDADSSSSGAGIIEFVIKDNRVRFEIDDEAAAQNGLVISSKLLSLALNVKRRTLSQEDL